MGLGDGKQGDPTARGSSLETIKNLMDLKECIEDSPHFRFVARP